MISLNNEYVQIGIIVFVVVTAQSLVAPLLGLTAYQIVAGYLIIPNLSVIIRNWLFKKPEH